MKLEGSLDAFGLPDVVTLLATTVLFLYVPNFWLCWLLHAAIMLVASTLPTFAARERNDAL